MNNSFVSCFCSKNNTIYDYNRTYFCNKKCISLFLENPDKIITDEEILYLNKRLYKPKNNKMFIKIIYNKSIAKYQIEKMI
jgi:YHS domain-containing protein